jgi:hypothetical protein
MGQSQTFRQPGRGHPVHREDQEVQQQLNPLQVDQEVQQQLNPHPANQVDLEALEFPLLIK